MPANSGTRNGLTKLGPITKNPRNPNITRKPGGSRVTNQNAAHRGARTAGLVKVHNPMHNRAA